MRCTVVILLLILSGSIARSQMDNIPADTAQINKYYKIAEKWRDASYYDSAIYYYEQIQAHYQKTEQWDMYIECRNGIGTSLSYLGYMDQAEEIFTEALVIAKEKLGELNPQTVDTYNMMGINYYFKGETDKTLEYFIKASNIAIRLYGEDNLRVINAYNNIGIVYSEKGLHQEAINFHKKALEGRIRIYGPKHQVVGQSLDNLGAAYSYMGLDSIALEHHLKALEINRETLGDSAREVAYSYSNIGNIYDRQGDKRKALEFYHKDLAIVLKIFGEKNWETALSYYNIALMHHVLKDYDSALFYAQKAIISNVRSFNNSNINTNPRLDQILDPKSLVRSLSLKAEALVIRDTLDYDNHFLAYQTYSVCDSLVEKLQKAAEKQSDKMEITRMAKPALDYAAYVAVKLAEWSPKVRRREFKERAFYFNEKIKAAILTQALAEVSAKKFAGIPDSLLTKEQELKADILEVEQYLSDESLDTEQRISLQEQNFTLNKDLNQLIAFFERSYPKYFELKYNIKIASVADVQQVLDKKTAILLYTIGSDGVLSIELIKKKSIDFYFVRLQHDITRYSAALRNSILYKDDDTFKEAAYTLFQSLFPNKKDLKDIDHLVIVPDEALTIIPFEVLLTEDPGQQKYQQLSYSVYPFLIKQYSISYAYSANLFYQQQLTYQRNKKKKRVRTKEFLGIAPVFSDPSSGRINAATRSVLTNTSLKNTRGGIFRGEFITPLPGTEQEVNAIASLYNNGTNETKILMGSYAREESFKQNELKDYRYIHIATHGFVNEEEPQFSGILFAQDSSSSEDGILYSGEIYNIELDADLITLSACETGLGKIAQGEGIIGLSRALLYAGARNMMLSLWKVSDASTSELMINFYKDLVNQKQPGMFSKSLRKTKLKMIMDGGETANPYYWSPFILIGR